MTRIIDGWACIVSDELRVASRGPESVSYEPGEVMVVTCSATGVVKIPSAVVDHLMNRPQAKPTPNAFHDHLDGCVRCREQPFNLCPAGSSLLTQEATK